MTTSYKSLLVQKTKLEEQLEAARQKEVAAAIDQIHAIMAEYDITPEELGFATRSAKAKRARPPVEAKYRDPQTGATWSGRGRAPAWLGKNRDKFLIAAQ